MRHFYRDCVNLARLEIDREIILKVLDKEPLGFGQFFIMKTGSAIESCITCAVGSIIRKVLHPDILQEYKACSSELGMFFVRGVGIGLDPDRLIRDDNYFGALSCFFEQFRNLEEQDVLGYWYVSQQTRSELKQFVLDKFPEKVPVLVPKDWIAYTEMKK